MTKMMKKRDSEKEGRRDRRGEWEKKAASVERRRENMVEWRGGLTTFTFIMLGDLGEVRGQECVCLSPQSALIGAIMLPVAMVTSDRPCVCQTDFRRSEIPPPHLCEDIYVQSALSSWTLPDIQHRWTSSNLQ